MLAKKEYTFVNISAEFVYIIVPKAPITEQINITNATIRIGLVTFLKKNLM